ncbi:MAG: hypothetical protein JNJ53_13645 [Rhizobiales bacterium]|nr:hypothetical protein [Hyphomicrobiales bacterium]
MSKFDDFLDAVRSGVGDLAKDTLKGVINQAKEDAEDFLKRSALDLKRWSDFLATGELSKDEFEGLVKGLKSLAKMHALTVAGISIIKINRFRNAVINLVIDAAFSAFLPL